MIANEWLWKEKLQQMNGCGKRNDSKRMVVEKEMIANEWLWKKK
jgi:hypothetical protein